jgi:LCP family protein required for cell wall assembly
MRVRHRGEDNIEIRAMDSTVEIFADMLGFEVDYWVSVSMRAFVSLINAIDGVDFFVPVNMNYHDPYQDLSINFTRGMQRLNGQQALEVLRFRNYASGAADIARIETQQDFLTSAAQQILARRSSISILELADIFLRNVRTDMSLDNLIWFGRRFLELDADNINFHVMPGNSQDFVGNQSYVTIYVDEWLELVNNTLSPFNDEITPADVSILTRGEDRRLYVTDGNMLGDPTWGSTSRGPAPPSSSGSGSASRPPSNTQGNGSGTSGSSSGSSDSGSGSGSSGSSGSGSGSSDTGSADDDPQDSQGTADDPPDDGQNGDGPPEDPTPQDNPDSDPATGTPPDDNASDGGGDSSSDRQTP